MTRSGAGVAVTGALLALAGVLLGYPELLLLGIAGLGCLVLALAALLVRDDLAVERVVDPVRVVEGGTTSVRLTFVNRRRRRALPVVAQERLGPALATVAVPSLAGGRRWSAVVGLPAPERGRHEVPPLSVGHGDPLRLVQRRRTVGAPAAVWVHPRTCPLAPLPSSANSDLDGMTSAHSAQGGAAFHSLREYRPGDDPRLIHWASTARTGELVVRHLVVPDETHHLVVLNTRAADYPEPAAFEDAVRFAASWCVASARAECPLTVATTSGSVAEIGHMGPAGPDPRAALDLLAQARLGGSDDPGLAHLPTTALRRPGMAVGVVTGHATPEEVALLPALAVGAASLSMACIDSRGARTFAAGGVHLAVGADLHGAAEAWNRVRRR